MDQFKVTMLLADSAQVSEGKLYVLGGGWSVISRHAPSAIAMLIEVPWERTNVRLPVVLELVDSDGHAVTAPNPEAGQQEPITAEVEIEVGRPPGIPPGTRIPQALALNLSALPLSPGGRFEWRLSVGGETRDDWRLPFNVRPEPG